MLTIKEFTLLSSLQLQNPNPIFYIYTILDDVMHLLVVSNFPSLRSLISFLKNDVTFFPPFYLARGIGALTIPGMFVGVLRIKKYFLPWWRFYYSGKYYSFYLGFELGFAPDPSELSFARASLEFLTIRWSSLVVILLHYMVFELGDELFFYL